MPSSGHAHPLDAVTPRDWPESPQTATIAVTVAGRPIPVVGIGALHDGN
jgi:hypothetical protein